MFEVGDVVKAYRKTKGDSKEELEEELNAALDEIEFEVLDVFSDGTVFVMDSEKKYKWNFMDSDLYLVRKREINPNELLEKIGSNLTYNNELKAKTKTAIQNTYQIDNPMLIHQMVLLPDDIWMEVSAFVFEKFNKEWRPHLFKISLKTIFNTDIF